MTLPEGDSGFPSRWRPVKTAFSKSLPRAITIAPANLRPGERGIWQRRYWEHTIRDERDYALHMDYIHFNPVKHRLVRHPASWKYSTFRRCVSQGVYPADWVDGDIPLEATGERPDAW